MKSALFQTFERLLQIADELLGPTGCAWDKEQTLRSLQPYLLEETHELIEAIDTQDSEAMLEELGDVFYALVFIAKLAANEQRFQLEDALTSVGDKLIRRHPHVFGGVKVNSTDDIVRNWETIKRQEKGKDRKHLFDGIPPSLPTLPRAQKMAHRLAKQTKAAEAPELFGSEEELGELLWRLVREAEAKGIEIDGALRRRLGRIDSR